MAAADETTAPSRVGHSADDGGALLHPSKATLHAADPGSARPDVGLARPDGRDFSLPRACAQRLDGRQASAARGP